MYNIFNIYLSILLFFFSFCHFIPHTHGHIHLTMYPQCVDCSNDNIETDVSKLLTGRVCTYIFLKTTSDLRVSELT